MELQMDSFRQLFQYILSGLSNGAIYALIGFGFAIIYNSTGIINFAQGEFVIEVETLERSWFGMVERLVALKPDSEELAEAV